MKNSSYKEQGPKGPVLPTNHIDREQIKQEIRELDALRMDSVSQELGDLVYHRINELLDLLDSAD